MSLLYSTYYYHTSKYCYRHSFFAMACKKNMANSDRNRNSQKGKEKESRKGTAEENRGNRKLADNPANDPEKSNTSGDTSNGKYSRTKMRDEDIDNDDTRGGL